MGLSCELQTLFASALARWEHADISGHVPLFYLSLPAPGSACLSPRPMDGKAHSPLFSSALQGDLALNIHSLFGEGLWIYESTKPGSSMYQAGHRDKSTHEDSFPRECLVVVSDLFAVGEAMCQS